jgi:hypothetical protein
MLPVRDPHVSLSLSLSLARNSAPIFFWHRWQSQILVIFQQEKRKRRTKLQQHNQRCSLRFTLLYSFPLQHKGTETTKLLPTIVKKTPRVGFLRLPDYYSSPGGFPGKHTHHGRNSEHFSAACVNFPHNGWYPRKTNHHNSSQDFPPQAAMRLNSWASDNKGDFVGDNAAVSRAGHSTKRSLKVQI